MKLTLEQFDNLEIDESFIHPNFDKESVRRLIRNSEQAMKSKTALALQSAERESDLLDHLVEPNLFKFDKDRAEVVAERVRKELEAVAGEEPPTAQTISGHNPNIFPPFFRGGGFSTVGGVVTTPRFSQQPEAGVLGLSVAAYPPGGHISRSLFMSALSIAPSSEMVTASVSAFIAGTIAAIWVLGYGRASARLMVSIAAEGRAGFASSGSTVSIGDLAFGVTRIPLTNMTASTRLMINAGDMLLISCGLGVTAGCGGIVCSAVSNFTLSGAVLCLL